MTIVGTENYFYTSSRKTTQTTNIQLTSIQSTTTSTTKDTASFATMLEGTRKDTEELQLAEKKDKIPYASLVKDGLIKYNGVTFVCDYEKNQLCLGDTSNPKECLTIPLSGGGSLMVNKDSLGLISKSIGMFCPEDVRRILEAMAQYNKMKQMEQEIDETTSEVAGNMGNEAAENKTVESTATQSKPKPLHATQVYMRA